MDVAGPITLQSGVWRDGDWIRDAQIRPMTGEDEWFVLETGHISAPERTTALLARCVLDIGSRPADVDLVRDLTVGDREALLLHLRRATHGDRLECVVRCPWDGCGEMLELDVSVGSLILDPYDAPREIYEVAIGRGKRRRVLRFRLPTGADQEAVASITDPTVGASQLMERCVVDGAQLAPYERDVVEQEMMRLDPQADITLELLCTACGESFSAPFDTGAFLLSETTGRRDDLTREVHLLAFHYHWSQSEILAMPRDRRRSYLGQLTDALTPVTS